MLCAIIPTLNAGDHIDGLLSDLAAHNIPVIVADGGSTDNTLDIALRYGARLALGAAGRGTQLARGVDWAVKTSEADWFLILHADCRFCGDAAGRRQASSDWALALTLHMNAHADKAAYFRFRANARGLWPRIMEFCVRFRELTFGGPYGDQGLLISRALYDSVGGYRAVPLFEDVMMIDALQAGGHLRRLSANLYTDVSAYKREGYWARATRNLRLLKAYRRGEDVTRLSQTYRQAAR